MLSVILLLFFSPVQMYNSYLFLLKNINHSWNCEKKIEVRTNQVNNFAYMISN
ncbi:hypothetical protein ES705_20721 [subsurface metagenome]